MSSLKIQNTKDAITFKAKIVPGSSKTCIAGILNGMLKVKIAAPPEKGRANQQLIKFLSKFLEVKDNSIKITSGNTSPIKTIQVTAITAEIITERIGCKTN